MKKEIEVKAKVNDIGFLRKKLEEMGCTFTATVTQDDEVFVNFDVDYTKLRNGSNFLRIRKTKGKILFTLKQSQTNELDCIEKEVEISDAKEFREALEIMGYHKVVEIHKTRTKTKYKDMEICLDEVVGLGSFVEVERIMEGDSEQIQKELFEFLETLGVKKEDQVMNGYDTLIFLKNKK